MLHEAFIAGDWTVLHSRNLLVRGDERVRLEPRVMDLLVHLAGHADRIVSKEELIAHVWKGRFVTDDVLTVTIYALRKALGGDARKPRYVETVSRRGCRLIAAVRDVERSASKRPSVGAQVRYVAAAALTLFVIGAMWTVRNGGRHVQSPEAWVNVEPGFDPLRPDARFQQIAARRARAVAGTQSSADLHLFFRTFPPQRAFRACADSRAG